ncbi:hypothetical protein R1sor_005587 [Riccia sorocarpa]|uniref:DNA-directed RNA polymerase n=1 Tax=Riccia sorocarpa TaxID=122646 RepID=A0ABD3HLY5_9MARC
MKQEIANSTSLELAKCLAVGKTSLRKQDKNPTARSSHELEDVAVDLFGRSQSQTGDRIIESIPNNNCLMAMVRSGSKGSSMKVMQQIGSLGLQVLNGDILLAAERNPKLVALATAMGYSPAEDELRDAWEMRGLVQSSLLDGLQAHEFFTHAIATHDSIFRQSLFLGRESYSRSSCFSSMMCIGYDDTVTLPDLERLSADKVDSCLIRASQPTASVDLW